MTELSVSFEVWGANVEELRTRAKEILLQVGHAGPWSVDMSMSPALQQMGKAKVDLWRADVTARHSP